MPTRHFVQPNDGTGHWDVVDEHGSHIATFDSESQAAVAAAGPELLSAALVIALDREISTWLSQNDPQAHKQLIAALTKAGAADFYTHEYRLQLIARSLIDFCDSDDRSAYNLLEVFENYAKQFREVIKDAYG